MAKQKRKGPKVTEKKSKKLKKAFAEEIPGTPESIADTEEAGSKVAVKLRQESHPSLKTSLSPGAGPTGGRPPCPPGAHVCLPVSASTTEPASATDTAAVKAPEGEAASRVHEEGPELSPEERRVLERKLKKERKKEEKKRLREAGVAAAQAAAAKPSGAALALDYLCGWAQKQENWKFQKTRQTWLLLHMYDSDQVPDKHFSTLLAYLEGLKGRARELTVQKAEAMMQELDEAGAEAAVQGKAQRLRQVLQLLS